MRVVHVVRGVVLGLRRWLRACGEKLSNGRNRRARMQANLVYALTRDSDWTSGLSEALVEASVSDVEQQLDQTAINPVGLSVEELGIMLAAAAPPSGSKNNVIAPFATEPPGSLLCAAPQDSLLSALAIRDADAAASISGITRTFDFSARLHGAQVVSDWNDTSWRAAEKSAPGRSCDDAKVALRGLKSALRLQETAMRAAKFRGASRRVIDKRSHTYERARRCLVSPRLAALAEDEATARDGEGRLTRMLEERLRLGEGRR